VGAQCKDNFPPTNENFRVVVSIFRQFSDLIHKID
jgi:hypothetical protein